MLECENENTIPGRARGRLINLSNAEHVWISGLTLQNGPSWNVHMIYCKDIVRQTIGRSARNRYGTEMAGSGFLRSLHHFCMYVLYW